jgi:hypothetical protein
MGACLGVWLELRRAASVAVEGGVGLLGKSEYAECRRRLHLHHQARG